MKKKRLVLLFVLLSVLGSFSISAIAAENNYATMTLEETRSVSEVNALQNIYKQLFPEEYHYIEEYRKNGVVEMASENINIIFSDAKEVENTTYELIVMNNGQIFTNYHTLNTAESIGRVKLPSSGDFTVGDLGHYTTFSIEYTIDTLDYDCINRCTGTSGSGFYLYPTNLSIKWEEDSNGPAYYGYKNVSMNYDGSGVLYDIGVGVGNNQAKGISNISSGADMWVWAFLYALFFQ